MAKNLLLILKCWTASWWQRKTKERRASGILKVRHVLPGHHYMASSNYDYNLSAYQQSDRDWNNSTHMVPSFSVTPGLPDSNAYMKPSPSPLPDQQSAGSITPPNNDYNYHYNMQTGNNDHGKSCQYLVSPIILLRTLFSSLVNIYLPSGIIPIHMWRCSMPGAVLINNSVSSDWLRRSWKEQLPPEQWRNTYQTASSLPFGTD